MPPSSCEYDSLAGSALLRQPVRYRGYDLHSWVPQRAEEARRLGWLELVLQVVVRRRAVEVTSEALALLELLSPWAPSRGDAVGCIENAKPTYPAGAATRVDDDFDVATERVQKPQKPIRRETLQLAAHKVRNIRLVHAEQLGGARLRQPTVGDCGCDLSRELGLGKRLPAIRHLQVLEYIARTFSHDVGLPRSALNPLLSASAHSAPLLA